MKLGILCLQTRFERQPGDAGHPATWPFEVCTQVMSGVTPDTVMHARPAEIDTTQTDTTLVRIVQAMQALAQQNVDCITTTCGFLVLQQRALAACCPVPFFSSSLLQLPGLLASLPATQTVGIIASNAQALTCAHWRAAGVAPADEKRLRVAGFDEQSHFIRYMRGQDPVFDAQRQQQEVLAVAAQLDHCAAIVSECANLPRYAHLIHAHTRCPVWDLRTLVCGYASGHDLTGQGAPPEAGVVGGCSRTRPARESAPCSG